MAPKRPWFNDVLIQLVNQTSRELGIKKLHSPPWQVVAGEYSRLTGQLRTSRECSHQWSMLVNRKVVPESSPFGRGITNNMLRAVKKSKITQPPTIHPADKIAGGMRQLVQLAVEEQLRAFKSDVLRSVAQADKTMNRRIREVVAEIFEDESILEGK